MPAAQTEQVLRQQGAEVNEGFYNWQGKGRWGLRYSHSAVLPRSFYLRPCLSLPSVRLSPGSRAEQGKLSPHIPLEVFEALRNITLEACARFAAAWSAPERYTALDTHELQLWLAYYPPRAALRHTNHVHDAAFCSGVYYAQVGEGDEEGDGTAGPAAGRGREDADEAAAAASSPLVFSDPRGMRCVCAE
eukprot:SAG22_NODE_14_length_33165_cov_13.196698_21_plen_190_part_00